VVLPVRPLPERVVVVPAVPEEGVRVTDAVTTYVVKPTTVVPW
jgi:hypothetical protein